MKHKTRVLTMLLAVCCIFSCSVAIASSTASYQEAVVLNCNQERAERGLSTLKLDSRLSELAKILAMEQEGSKRMSGTRPGGEKWSSIFKEYGYSYAAGEAGCNWHSSKFQPSAQKLVDYWMGKEGFWQNVVYAGGFTHTGVYSYYSQQDRIWYTVQLFAKSTGSSPLKAPQAENAAATGNANVRAWPGTSYKKLGKLKTGERVSVIKMLDNGWAKIDWNGRYAYVSNSYLKAAENVPVDVVSDTPLTSITATATGNVNVRTGPGTSYSKLGKLKRGQTVSVWDISGKWVQIIWQSSSVKAYVHINYLRFEP